MPLFFLFRFLALGNYQPKKENNEKTNKISIIILEHPYLLFFVLHFSLAFIITCMHIVNT